MRIMLVDDEPFFLKQLKEKIVSLREDLNIPLEIIAECYSGQEALEMLPVMPDCIFTDIRMASLDGIELAKAIQSRMPNISVVIVSAYPTFDYAREAIRANVIDYLLKPIDTSKLQEVVLRMLQLQKAKQYQRTKEWLRGFIEGRSDLPDRTFLPYTSYRVLLTQNPEGPHSDPLFLSANKVQEQETYRNHILPFLEKEEEIWLFTSENGRYYIILLGIINDSADKLQKVLQSTQSFFSRNDLIPSICFSEKTDQVTKLHPTLQRMFDRLKQSIVIGRPLLVSESVDIEYAVSILSETDERRIVSLLTKNDQNELIRLFKHWIKAWENINCSSVSVEMNLKRIIYLMEQKNWSSGTLRKKMLEVRIEEIVYSAKSFDELAEAFCNIVIKQFLFMKDESVYDNDVKLFSKIQAHLAANIGQPVTLGDLTKEFYISSTTLCNLFRDSSGKSFLEYFTSLRMEKAKAFMRDYPNMLNKEIAEMVGYQDQNYFSRVFKTVVGMSPTLYRSAIEETK